MTAQRLNMSRHELILSIFTFFISNDYNKKQMEARRTHTQIFALSVIYKHWCLEMRNLSPNNYAEAKM